MRAAPYTDLLRVARRCAFAAEAEDIVQDAFLAAVADGLDPSDPAVLPWLRGVVRKRAAFLARSAGRRRRRDQDWVAMRPSQTDAPSASPFPAVDALPSAQRAVLALALSGHDRREIAYLLRIGNATLRQRITALRRSLRMLETGAADDFVGLRGALDYGRIRAGLRALVGPRSATFGSHDPDGHLFAIVGASRNTAARQQEA